jgi:hypothetical protein
MYTVYDIGGGDGMLTAVLIAFALSMLLCYLVSRDS